MLASDTGSCVAVLSRRRRQRIQQSSMEATRFVFFVNSFVLLNLAKHCYFVNFLFCPTYIEVSYLTNVKFNLKCDGYLEGILTKTNHDLYSMFIKKDITFPVIPLFLNLHLGQELYWGGRGRRQRHGEQPHGGSLRYLQL